MTKYKTLRDLAEAYKGSQYKIVCVCEGDKMPPYRCYNERDMKELLQLNCELEKVTFSRKCYGLIYAYVM